MTEKIPVIDPDLQPSKKNPMDSLFEVAGDSMRELLEEAYAAGYEDGVANGKAIVDPVPEVTLAADELAEKQKLEVPNE